MTSPLGRRTLMLGLVVAAAVGVLSVLWWSVAGVAGDAGAPPGADEATLGTSGAGEPRGASAPSEVGSGEVATPRLTATASTGATSRGAAATGVVDASTHAASLVPDGGDGGAAVSARSCTVRGQVLADAKPLPSALIELRRRPFEPGPSDLADTTASDTAGRFEFSGLKPSRYAVIVREPGYIPTLRQGLDCSNGEQHEVSLALTRGGTHVIGSVTNRSGTPLRDANVRLHCLTPSVLVVPLAVSPRGTFEVWVGPGMECQINAHLHGYTSDAAGFRGTEPTERADIILDRESTLGGRVLDGDRPVAGAQVNCWVRTRDGSQSGSAETDQEGRFECSVAAGEVLVCATAANRFGWGSARLGVGEKGGPLVVTMAEGRRVSGTVKLATGAPAAMVRVLYYHPSSGFCTYGLTTTDIAGTFIAAGLPPDRPVEFHVFEGAVMKQKHATVPPTESTVELLYDPGL